MDTPIQLPARPGFREISWIVDSAVSRSGSPFTLSEQLYEWPGQRWSVVIKLPAMQPDDARAWQAFFLNLNGTAGCFYLGESEFLKPAGLGFGTPELDGPHTTGAMIKTRGWAPLQQVLKRGQKVEIGGRMRQVMEDVFSTESGKASFRLWPHCRELPDAMVLEWQNPRGVFRPRSVPELTWDKNRMQASFQFAADEVIAV